MTNELNQVEDVRSALQALRRDVIAGNVYQTLPNKLHDLVTKIPHNEATPVTPVDDEDGIKGLLSRLKHELRDSNEPTITDDELLQLVDHLGSTEIAVRDHGIYFFFNAALQHQALTEDQMRLVVNALLQDRVLFSHITEPDNDGVFQRSFAILILSAFAYADRVGNQFFTEEMTERMVVQLMTYIVLESDTRGFVDNKGWVHTYTHIGNLLDELADSPVLARADKILLMNILLAKFRELSTPLIFGEDRRLAAYLGTLTNTNDLYVEAFLHTWRNWRSDLSRMPRPETEGGWNKLFNRSRLLSAMLIQADFTPEIMDALGAESEFMA